MSMATESTPPVEAGAHGGHRRDPGSDRRWFEKSVVRLVGRELGVRPREILCRERRADRIAHARQLAMYLLHVGAGRGMEEVAKVFGRHRTTVSHACGRVEDRRDSSRFDDLVARLEAAVAALDAERRPSGGEGTHARN